ncbi:putative phosphoric monoester hydrolase [Rosa chinensis]|uniref:Putative phosphoric monoester hydrolase n=1 Tax=Rosa chinensis TaxID=74649 RepID=A0A2P6R154_ROSCH|nr:putative phosphoric monoester hydrolase [Rosa chinensis]
MLKLKIKPSYNYFVATPRAVSHLKLDCLLEGEQVEVEGYGIVLINTDEAGTLIVTNFRLLFLSEGTRNVIPLGTIPLATIEKFKKMHVGRKVRDKWIYWWNLNLGSSSVLVMS